MNLARAHYAKGALLLARNETDKAMASFSLVAPADGSGQLPEAYVSIGDVLFSKKQFAEACPN